MQRSRHHIAHFALITLTGFVAWQCTDVIAVEVEDVPEQLVIDAWINNLPQPQTIRLTLSQPYFDNAFAPPVTDADIAVTDDEQNVYPFTHEGDGNYVWTPGQGETLGDVGTEFTLGISWDGDIYAATSEMRRVPLIDSLVTEFREEELGLPAGIYAEVFARDFSGTGDTYWIKAYKNGHFLNKPVELNIAYDAAFDAGSQVDGLVFITPIRELINRIPDPDGPDDFDVPPYAPGDSIRVEIHSITREAFEFLKIARDQMNNGANAIFAIPLANPQGNIIAVSTQAQALGFFCVSAVSREGKIIE